MENWTIEWEAEMAEYETRKEYEAWLAEVEATIPLEEPEGEVDAWGLPRRNDAEFGTEQWNPTEEQVTEYWKMFWEKVMEV